MSVFAYSSFPKGEYSNLFIVAAFSSKSLFGTASLRVKKSYLLIFPEIFTGILAF